MKKIKIIFACILVFVMLGSMSINAKDTAESITAVYRNIKLVVDGTLVEPKDANGELVEPFIYNGTTYLPVRAVGTAFNKQVQWDGDNNTVYLGGKVDKPAKELTLPNRSYIECSDISKIETYIDKGVGHIWVNDGGETIDVAGKGKRQVKSITYPLNSLAKKITGEFFTKGDKSGEGVLRIKNSNGKVIYTSPIMRPAVDPVTFDVNVENEITVTLEFEYTNSSMYDYSMIVRNPIIVSSDY